MHTEPIILRDQQYTLRIRYQDNDQLRAAFNAMSQEFWRFDFEEFYRSGYWMEDCILYSLFDQDKIVSHITLTLFPAIIGNTSMTLGQLGTVMTAKQYQHRGLSRYLINRIQEDYGHQIDGMFLFANDSVLDFYPRFGYKAVPEYQGSKKIGYNPNGLPVQQLDLEDLTQRAFFQDFVERSVSVSSFHLKNVGLAFFYCYAYPRFGFKDTVYHIPDLATIVVAKTKAKVLTIVQIYQEREQGIDDVIRAIASPEVDTVMFGYNASYPGLSYSLHKQKDLTLFVTPELEELFAIRKTMVPLLSHT